MKKYTDKTMTLPMIPARGIVIFPGTVTHFDVARDKSVKALEKAMQDNQIVFIASQRDSDLELPTPEDIYFTGTIAKIKQMLKMPGEHLRILVEGISRGEIIKFTSDFPYFEVEVVEDDTAIDDSVELTALKRLVLKAYENYLALSNRVPVDVIMTLNSVDDPLLFSDIAASNLHIDYKEKQEILDIYDVEERLRKVVFILNREVKILKVEKDINEKVKSQINQSQKEYYLREQMKVIRTELGDDDADEKESIAYRKKLQELDIDDKIKSKIDKEISRYLRLQNGTPEKSNLKTYLEWVFDLPWDNFSEDKNDISRTREILDEDHYGLKDVKERIVEYLAIRQMSNTYKGSMICLVGPPGVGKTSIVKSIARSMNRQFVRMSLGGVKDESEIRGHRRTYVGSMPGRIISAMKEVGTKNPVFLFDEIDKLASDFRGDPASALLEVLDPSQNETFVDRYLELPFDLSNVLFITTANSLSTIPWPLLDRMEVIELSSYTSYEKLEIAKKYLVKKQMKQHGLKSAQFKISDGALNKIISSYTREAGVRDLERTIAKVMRKVVLPIVEGTQKSASVSNRNIEKYLGAPRKIDDALPATNQVGVVTGLAWTSVGGVTLEIEVSVLQGTGKLQLTGQMGDVMKESAVASVSYIRTRAMELGIDPNFHEKLDIHIHIPEGAVPKDGPSAGVTITTALASALSGIAVKRTVAMTGEITLRGRVLQIGGLKEKSIAAIRHGVKTVIIPHSNLKDLEKIPDELKEQVEFIPVKHMDEVIEAAFEHKPIKFKATSPVKKVSKSSKKKQSKNKG